VAVLPPPTEISVLRRALPPSASLTRSSGWHITLVFLGDVAESRVGAVAEILGSIPPPGGFSLRLSGKGHFGNVAWAAVDGDVSVLCAFREQVRSALAAGGFPSDGRPYQPHLTVTYRSEPGVPEALAGYSGAAWPVESFALVKSVGGAYEPVLTWPTTHETKAPAPSP
jgi:2'-5' RNA ligase